MNQEAGVAIPNSPHWAMSGSQDLYQSHHPHRVGADQQSRIRLAPPL